MKNWKKFSFKKNCKYLTHFKLNIFLMILLVLVSFLASVVIEKNIAYGDNNSIVSDRTKITKTQVENKKEKINKFIEEIEKPDYSFEKKTKDFAKNFFSGTGVKILIVICIFLSVLFFFRFRNYTIALVFYILANFFTFFGYKIAHWLFK